MKLFGSSMTILFVGVINLAYSRVIQQTVDLVCNINNLPLQIVVDDINKYDKALYREPACLGEPPIPAQCDYMGLVEDCSSCFTTCEGANKYIADYLDDIDETMDALDAEFIKDLTNFCPDSDVDSLDDCSSENDSSTD